MFGEDRKTNGRHDCRDSRLPLAAIFREVALRTLEKKK